MNYKSKITNKMKKEYLTPLAEVEKIEAETMICGSGDGNNPLPDVGDENPFG